MNHIWWIGSTSFFNDFVYNPFPSISPTSPPAASAIHHTAGTCRRLADPLSIGFAWKFGQESPNPLVDHDFTYWMALLWGTQPPFSDTLISFCLSRGGCVNYVHHFPNPSIVPMCWFQGKPTGNHGFYPPNTMVPEKFPIFQWVMARIPGRSCDPSCHEAACWRLPQLPPPPGPGQVSCGAWIYPCTQRNQHRYESLYYTIIIYHSQVMPVY